MIKLRKRKKKKGLNAIRKRYYTKDEIWFLVKDKGGVLKLVSHGNLHDVMEAWVSHMNKLSAVNSAEKYFIIDTGAGKEEDNSNLDAINASIKSDVILDAFIKSGDDLKLIHLVNPYRS